MLFRRLCCLPVVISMPLALSFAPRLAAQPSEAAVLFDAGVADMLAGRFDRACPALARSVELEPLPGALFTLAECLAGQGKTATALARYTDFQALVAALPAERRTGFQEREALAFRQMALLRQRTPGLIVLAPPGEEAPVVTINGEPLEPAAFGVERLLDPGPYEVVARVESRPPFREVIVLDEGDHRRLVIPRLEPQEPGEPRSANEQRPPSASSSRRWLYATGAVGLTGLVVGTSAGIFAWSRKQQVDEHCPERTCDPEGRRALDSARGAATLSNVGLAVGVVGLSSAALLYWLGPEPSKAARRDRPRFVVSASPASLELQGEF